MMPTAVILGASSDIGRELGVRLKRDGWDLVGLGRAHMKDLSCLHKDGLVWDLFVSAVGTTLPIGPFFELDFDEWRESFVVNSLSQLRVLHGIWTLRRPGKVVDVMLMAGGGTNGPFTNYSAYAAAKITLIKMTELLDDENPDGNFFIIGPGYVSTKIHNETMIAGRQKAGKHFDRMLEFFKTPGTRHDDIYAHMRWCMERGKAIVGGRNFSTVHDPWCAQGWPGDSMLGTPDENSFRLRRHGW